MNVSKTKQVIFTFFISVAIPFLFFLLCEFSARLFSPTELTIQYTDRHLLKDSVYVDSMGLVPNSSGFSNGALVRVDEFGFRKIPTRVSQSDSTILVVGDSVPFGLGVEENDLFFKFWEPDFYTIINATLIGYNVHDYSNVIQSMVKRKSSNIQTVILFWTLNDIYDRSQPSYARSTGSSGWTIYFSEIFSFLRSNSKFYIWLKYQLTNRASDYYEFDKRLYETTSIEFMSAMNKLYEINRFCKAEKINLKVILLPYSEQFVRQDFSPQNLMTEKLTELSIEFWNAQEAFKGDHKVSYYLLGDGIHLSKMGHEALGKWMKDTEIDESNY